MRRAVAAGDWRRLSGIEVLRIWRLGGIVHAGASRSLPDLHDHGVVRRAIGINHIPVKLVDAMVAGRRRIPHA
jgi:hypothetical protein